MRQRKTIQKQFWFVFLCFINHFVGSSRFWKTTYFSQHVVYVFEVSQTLFHLHVAILFVTEIITVESAYFVEGFRFSRSSYFVSCHLIQPRVYFGVIYSRKFGVSTLVTISKIVGIGN